VLTLYLLPEVNLQLRPRLLAQLRPGTRVVSHDWDMGECGRRHGGGGRHDEAGDAGTGEHGLSLDRARQGRRFLASTGRGAGAQEAMELEFTQRFQEIAGVARRARGRTLLQSAHVRGPEIRFAVIDETRRARPNHCIFSGRVFGDTMEGTTGAGRAGVLSAGLF